MSKRVVVIGGGFAGLSSSAFLAKDGYDVTLLEKNDQIGGRARQFEAEGFTFDMGPSWYWMPDVFESFFEHFGHRASDFYDLVRLDPSYRVVFGRDDVWDIPASMSGLEALFERIEPGSSAPLRRFLEEAAYKYEVGMRDLVYKPGRKVSELMDTRLMIGALKLHVFRSFSAYIRKYFTNPRLLQLLEFPVLFLGALPQKTPALYSLMNYADMSLGTWYPQGGMHKIVEAMAAVAAEQGVNMMSGVGVTDIQAKGKMVNMVNTAHHAYPADVVVGAADYHHIDQKLLQPEFRNYSERYWDNRSMAPSCLLFYVGVNKRIPNLRHHNLFFDADFEQHAKEIYEDPKWPTSPLFYVCAPSKTDKTVAPKGHENLFLLIPVAPGLGGDDEALREKYFDLLIERMEHVTQVPIKDHVVYKRSYAHSNFIKDYHAFKGNAYGLANTLRQTANLKPSIKNRHLSNLYYTGQLTVPGPGVPPSLISGEVVAREIRKEYPNVKTNEHGHRKTTFRPGSAAM